MMSARGFARVVRLIVVALSATQLAVACSIAGTRPPIHVNSTFRAVVTSGKTPVASIKVALSDETGKVMAERTTDKMGVALFRSLRTGTYSVSAVRSGMYADEEIEITAGDAKSLSDVALSWPPTEVVRTRSLKGQFLCCKRVGTQADGGYVPIFRADLHVMDGNTGKAVADGKTSEDGTFDLSTLTPGLYIVHLRWPMDKPTIQSELEGSIPIEVVPNPEAPESVRLDVQFGGCGMSYRRAD